jgi:hypothetical protein
MSNADDVIEIAAKQGFIRDALGKDLGTNGERLLDALNKELYASLISEKVRGYEIHS